MTDMSTLLLAALMQRCSEGAMMKTAGGARAASNDVKRVLARQVRSAVRPGGARPRLQISAAGPKVTPFTWSLHQAQKQLVPGAAATAKPLTVSAAAPVGNAPQFTVAARPAAGQLQFTLPVRRQAEAARKLVVPEAARRAAQARATANWQQAFDDLDLPGRFQKRYGSLALFNRAKVGQAINNLRGWVPGRRGRGLPRQLNEEQWTYLANQFNTARDAAKRKFLNNALWTAGAAALLGGGAYATNKVWNLENDKARSLNV